MRLRAVFVPYPRSRLYQPTAWAARLGVCGQVRKRQICVGAQFSRSEYRKPAARLRPAGSTPGYTAEITSFSPSAQSSEASRPRQGTGNQALRLAEAYDARVGRAPG